MNLAANLHERLDKYEREVLLFIEKPEVPFTNNLAERALAETAALLTLRKKAQAIWGGGEED